MNPADVIKLLLDFFGQGGWVMVLIAVVSLLAWRQGLNSWRQANGIVKDLELARKFFEVGDGLGAVSGLAGEAELSDGGEVKTLLAAMKKVVASRLQGLEESLGFLRTMAAALPLLGLLGTVLGMLVTFKVIQGYGSGQPRLLAGGIRQALLTTQAGLWAALPVLFFHQLVSSRCRRVAAGMDLLFHQMETKLGWSGKA
ncbi:MAG: MotA/TolQ/ExbB proton channel family protein [Sedimentisphaerales bacterium]|nr:MotA/TolQ/ExbB proton channel family protein [Sedimentisphaerales bacterium]